MKNEALITFVMTLTNVTILRKVAKFYNEYYKNKVIMMKKDEENQNGVLKRPKFFFTLTLVIQPSKSKGLHMQ
jgi:hypothetical protein